MIDLIVLNNPGGGDRTSAIPLSAAWATDRFQMEPFNSYSGESRWLFLRPTGLTGVVFKCWKRWSNEPEEHAARLVRSVHLNPAQFANFRESSDAMVAYLEQEYYLNGFVGRMDYAADLARLPVVWFAACTLKGCGVMKITVFSHLAERKNISLVSAHGPLLFMTVLPSFDAWV